MTDSTLEIKLPALHATQQKVANGLKRYTILRAGRQMGKSYFASIEAIKKALEKDNQFIVVIAPTYKQTEAIYGRITKLLKPLIDYKVDDETVFARRFKADHRIEFYNGSIIMAASGDKPDRLRGYSIHYAIIDEAAMIDAGEELWLQVLRPALAVTRGGVLFISTPKGKDNWFYDLWKHAEYDLAENEKSEWALFHFKSVDSPFFPEEEAAAYRALGENFYLQECEAEFIATANRVISADDFHYYSTTISEGNVYHVYETQVVGENSCLRVMTVDLASSLKTSADYTAFAMGDITRNGMCFVRDVWRKRVAGPKLADTIVAYAKRNGVQIIYVESIGFQLTAIQELTARGMTVMPLIAKGDKVARSTALGIRMNAGQFVYPQGAAWIPSTMDEVTSFPDGVHDDRVDALSYLAITSAQYAMSSGPMSFGGVSLDQVHNAVIQGDEDPQEALTNLRATSKVNAAQKNVMRGGMALEKMRGPL